MFGEMRQPCCVSTSAIVRVVRRDQRRPEMGSPAVSCSSRRSRAFNDVGRFFSRAGGPHRAAGRVPPRPPDRAIAGTPSKPGPAIFTLADGQALSPIEGAVRRGNEIPQPSEGIYDWDDAIGAIFQNKTFLLMESPAYPQGVSGRIKRY